MYQGFHQSVWDWFVNGWLTGPTSAPGAPKALGSAGMVETGYETVSFIVLEHPGDGWFRFRYGKPAGGGDGVAWTHACHVEAQALRYEPWEDRFASGETSPLTFRSSAPHVLRAGPDASADRLHLIRGDHQLEPLAFHGDWMRARVTQPSDYCAGGTIEVTVHEGWVRRWRSPEKGPWVWYFTRGC